MLPWLFLLLLSFVTYLVIKRSAARITRTPVWLLWLVMMTPALVWGGWILWKGNNTPMPAWLMIAPFVVCPVVYWFLVLWGRPNADSVIPENSPTAGLSSTLNPESEEVSPSLGGGEATKLRPIDKEEEKALRNCFPWSLYYLQNLEYRPQAVICRGKLRSNPEVAYQTIRENVQALFGDRFYLVFQEGMNGSPFFALVPNPYPTDKTMADEVFRPMLALALFGATLLTTTLIGAVEYASVTNQALQNSPNLIWRGLPYALGLLGILGIQEFCHYFSAQSHRIRTTLPYFIPFPFFIGTFGAYIQRRSPVPNRRALFDMGLISCLAGFAIALPLLFWGLSQSQIVPLNDQSHILNFASLNPRFSFLLSVLSKGALGSKLTPNSAINLHPVGVAAYIGFIWTTFRLMPIGQLDGGRIVHAMFGQRMGASIGQITRFLMLALALVQPDLFIWAILLFFLPITDEPALNDVSELDNKRDIWGLLALALLVMILLPVPPTVTQWLNL